MDAGVSIPLTGTVSAIASLDKGGKGRRLESSCESSPSVSIVGEGDSVCERSSGAGSAGVGDNSNVERSRSSRLGKVLDASKGCGSLAVPICKRTMSRRSVAKSMLLDLYSYEGGSSPALALDGPINSCAATLAATPRSIQVGDVYA